jgi:dTDP-4-dehydrorhamnose 3,5-epimerase
MALQAKNRMQIIDTALTDVKLIRPRIYEDQRGWCAEVFNANELAAAGLPSRFVQDNQSISQRGVLRGLHYQIVQPQGKLVRALSGHIWDVAVDMRQDSPQFGQWAGFNLRGEDVEFVWIPEGFAHGFLVLSDTASVFYKTTDFYCPAGERSVRWNDPKLAITWPLDDIGEPIVSNKDASAPLLDATERRAS